MRLTKAVAAGYRDSNPAERGLFGVASSFAVTGATVQPGEIGGPR
jgi:hypothetical protein